MKALPGSVYVPRWRSVPEAARLDMQPKIKDAGALGPRPSTNEVLPDTVHRQACRSKVLWGTGKERAELARLKSLGQDVTGHISNQGNVNVRVVVKLHPHYCFIAANVQILRVLQSET